jgi:hypothetical protein
MLVSRQAGWGRPMILRIITAFLCAAMLTGPSSAQPAKIGMTAAEFHDACYGDLIFYQIWSDGSQPSFLPRFLIRQCAHHPDQYAVFEPRLDNGRVVNGTVTEVLNARDVLVLFGTACDEAADRTACRAAIERSIAENEAELQRISMRSLWTSEFGSDTEVLKQASNALRGYTMRWLARNPAGWKCYRTSATLTEGERTCSYDCQGAPAVFVQPRTAICPLILATG